MPKTIGGEIGLSGIPARAPVGATPVRPDPRAPLRGGSADRHRQLQRAKRIPHWGNLALALGRAGPLEGRQHNAIQSNAQPRATQQSGPTQHAVNPTRRARGAVRPGRQSTRRSGTGLAITRAPRSADKPTLRREASESARETPTNPLAIGKVRARCDKAGSAATFRSWSVTTGVEIARRSSKGRIQGRL